MSEFISSEYEIHLSGDEATRHEELKSDLVLNLPDGEIATVNVVSFTGKLPQLASGIIYPDTSEIIEFCNRKLDTPEGTIESANGKSIFVAYWLKHGFSRIKKRSDVREIKSNDDVTD